MTPPPGSGRLRQLPVAMAHRGGGGEAAENSRAALEHTRDLGYRVVETDLHRTADGVVVLLHDATVDRTTDGRGRLATMTWSQAAELRDHSGGRLVRLDEALRDFPSLTFNADLKEDSVLGPALRVLAEEGAAERLVLSSFSDARLRAVRRLGGAAVRTSAGTREIARLVSAASLPAGLATRAARRSGVPHPAGSVLNRARYVQVPVAYRGIRVVTPRFLATAHELGLEVHVWTIDEEHEMHRLLDLGVDGLVTDQPRLLREVLRSRGEWDPDQTP